MVKLRIEGTNPVSEGIDSCEVVDSNLDIDSTIEEFFDLFLRLLMGLSFSEKQLEKSSINLARSFIERMKEDEYEKNKLKLPKKLPKSEFNKVILDDNDFKEFDIK